MTTTTTPGAVATDEILPCPFCGGAARKGLTNGNERDGYANRMTISCSGCGARVATAGDTSKGSYADNSTVEARAISAWNRRAALDAQPVPVNIELEQQASARNAALEEAALVIEKAPDYWMCARCEAVELAREIRALKSTTGEKSQ